MKKLLLILLVYSTSLFGTVYNTTGSSSSWSNTSAWSTGSVPNMTQWDGSHDPSISHNMTYTGDMAISSGNVLTIKNGATLTITGTLKMGWNSNPGLVVEAGGRVIVNAIQYDSSPSSINNSGTINVTTTFVCGTAGILNSTGTFTTGGNFTISSSANVDFSGSNSIGGSLSVTGSGTDFDLNGGTLHVGTNATFNGDGNVTIDGDMTVSGDMSVTGSGGASVDGTLDIDGQLTIDNNGDMDGFGIVGWGTLSANPNCSPALLTCSGTGTSLDNNTVGWCAGTYTNPPGNPIDLTSCTSAALPVELIEFNLTSENGIVTLNWVTASEINNDYFEIQASKDGIKWSVIDKVNGAGNSFEINRYEKSLLTDAKYFRLRQVDFDGTYTFSNIIATSGIDKKTFITLSDNLIYIQHSNDYRLMIYDAKGGVVYRNDNLRDLFIIDVSLFNTGIYIINIGYISKKIYIK